MLTFQEWCQKTHPEEYQELFGIFSSPKDRWMKSQLVCKTCGSPCKPRHLTPSGTKDIEKFGSDIFFAVCPKCGLLEKSQCEPVRTLGNTLRRAAALF